METGEIVIYNSNEGKTSIDVKLIDDTVWLTQDQMGQLFGKSRTTINEHIKNIYNEKELIEKKQREKSEIPTFLTNRPTFIIWTSLFQSVIG